MKVGSIAECKEFSLGNKAEVLALRNGMALVRRLFSNNKPFAVPIESLNKCSFFQTFAEKAIDKIRYGKLDFKNEMDEFMLNEGDAIEKLSSNPKLEVIENAQNIANGHLKSIVGHFHEIHKLLNIIIRDMIRNNLNENDYQLMFDKIFEHLEYIYQSMTDLNKMANVKIKAEVVNNAMGLVQSYLNTINLLIKSLNENKTPEWFLKDNAADSGDNWNRKIQIAYFLCVDGVDEFLNIVEKFRKSNSGINNGFDLKSMNLMNGLDPAAKSSLLKSELVKELAHKAIRNVNPTAVVSKRI